MKLRMFRTVPVSTITSLFTVPSAMVYVIQLSSRTRSCSKAVHKPVWHIPLLSVQWINSWWWTEELSETCRVSCQNKFVKLVHLVGFIIKKFVTMHGHTNLKLNPFVSSPTNWHSFRICLSHSVALWSWFCTSGVATIRRAPSFLYK
jgi:hypothetical protein